MAPSESMRSPFRWEFAPVEDLRDQTIRWKWRAYDQVGEPVMESLQTFDSRMECMEDAKAAGYLAGEGR